MKSLIFVGCVENSDATFTILIPDSMANNGHAVDMQIKREGLPSCSSFRDHKSSWAWNSKLQ